MIDKELLSLIDGSGKKIFVCTLLSLLGLIANVTITAGICVAVNLVVEHGDAALYILPANAIIAGIIFRYLVTVSAGRNRAILGESVKKALRDRVFNKLLELEGYGDLGLASITQVALEGIEQLDLYFTSYLDRKSVV